MSKTVSKAFRRTLGGVAAVLCSAAVALTAGAETSGKISFDISTDKASYSAGEQVNVSMNVSNDGYYAITDVNISASVPSGFALMPGSSASAHSDTIAAGGTMQGDFSMTFSGGNNIPSPVIPSVVPSQPSNSSANNEIITASKDETPDKNTEDVSSASGIYENSELITIGGTSFHAGRTIAAFLICLAVFAGIFFFRKKKDIKKFFSVFLAVGLILPAIGDMGSIDAANEGSINASAVFTYNGREYKINANMKYSEDIREISDEEINDIVTVNEKIDELINSPEYLGLSKDQQIQKVKEMLDELCAESLIQSGYEYNESGSIYTFNYSCGVQGGVMIGTFGDEFDGSEETAGVGGNAPATAGSESLDTDSAPAVVEGLDILILNAFEDTSFRRDFYNRIEREWDAMGTNTVLDNNVTISDLIALNNCNYEAVVIAAHGGNYRTRQQSIVINENVDAASIRANSYYLYAQHTVSIVNGNSYWVSPAFFRENVTSCNTKLLYVQSCLFFGCTGHGGLANNFAEVFTNGSSVETVIGYYNSVASVYGREVMELTIEQMMTGTTAEEALNYAMGIKGSGDNSVDVSQDKYEAVPQIVGNRFLSFDNSSERGMISGKVVKASDRVTPIVSADINISRNGSMIRNTRSNETGNYSATLPVDEYNINISAEGYINFNCYANVIANENTYLETFLLVQGEPGQRGTASGKITNAMNGNGIAGVTLTIREGWNNSTYGEAVQVITTDENGNYTVDLPIGNYTIYSEKAGFIPATKNIIVQPDITTGNQNCAMTPAELGADDYYITLEWGENPRDVDSHLVGYTSDGERYHVYFADMEAYDNGRLVCDLDVDDVTSYGPEHITLETIPDTYYYYYLHRYAGTGTLGSSESKVTVHRNGEVVAVYNVPTDMGDGDYWNVFTIYNGTITTVNTITDSPVTGNIETAALFDAEFDEVLPEKPYAPADENEEAEVSDETNTDAEVSDETNNDTDISDETNTDTDISDETNTDTDISDETNTETEVSDETNTDTEVSGETNTDTEVSDETNTETEVSDETNTDTEVSDETNTDTEVSDETNTDTEVSDETNTDTEVSDETNTDTDEV